MITNKAIEIFCGTGGVGKTTLAVSRALALAEQGKKVLIITLDPSKRLKDYLGLDEKLAGHVQNLQIGTSGKTQLDALLMSPTKTLERIARSHRLETGFDNRIIKLLSRPYGGMNEIMGMVEVANHYTAHTYDSIILDTPPGKHFLDFLESIQKISVFFDNSFIQMFQFLSSNVKKARPAAMLSRLVDSGIKKILHYLEEMTGATFLEEFIDAINTIYQAQGSFIKALEVQSFLKEPKTCHWFLVTSTEHGKFVEANDLQAMAQNFLHPAGHLVLNKCLNLEEDFTGFSQRTIDIMQSYQQKEHALLKSLQALTSNVLCFPDMIEAHPQKNMHQLIKTWSAEESL